MNTLIYAMAFSFSIVGIMLILKATMLSIMSFSNKTTTNYLINDANVEFALYSIIERLRFVNPKTANVIVECDNISNESIKIIKIILRKFNYTIIYGNNSIKQINFIA